MEQSGADAVAGAIREMTVIYERVVVQIGALSPRESFSRVTELRDELEKLRAQTSRLRAEKADLIRSSEGLALSQLADAIKGSKAQADILVRLAQGRPAPVSTRRKRNQITPPD